MHKKILTVVGITILFLGACITPSVAIDNVYKSTIPISTGKTLYVGGSGEGNYTMIQDAIDNASEGDTIFVYDDSSPYYENVWIDKSINLIGENRNTTIINGIDWLKAGVAISSLTCNVLVSGFTITDNYTGVEGCTGIGIGGNNNIIQGNKIIFNENGIKLARESDNNIITNNMILHNNMVGIFDGSNDAYNTVKWNVIGGNGRDNPNYKKGGLFKHYSGGIYHHNDFDLNWGANAYTETSTWGVWDDGSEGNYWDDWESNPGYPDTYIIHGWFEDQIDNYPSTTAYFNHPIVCIISSYKTEPNRPIDFWADVNKPSSFFSWFWEFGDGTTSNKKSPEHAYNKSGIYLINVTVTDNKGVSDTDKSIAYIGIAPDKPAIKGPTKGKTRGRYEYSIVANDSDSDYLHYYIYWGDGYEDYIGPYPTGELVKITHTWWSEGNYTVMVKAIDEILLESDWTYFEVVIPRTRASSYLWFLERFPMLERLLNLLR